MLVYLLLLLCCAVQPVLTLPNYLGPARVAKFDMTHEPDTTNPFINRLRVEAKRVRVIFWSARLTRLINGSCSCSTCEPV